MSCRLPLALCNHVYTSRCCHSPHKSQKALYLRNEYTYALADASKKFYGQNPSRISQQTHVPSQVSPSVSQYVFKFELLETYSPPLLPNRQSYGLAVSCMANYDFFPLLGSQDGGPSFKTDSAMSSSLFHDFVDYSSGHILPLVWARDLIFFLNPPIFWHKIQSCCQIYCSYHWKYGNDDWHM